MAVWNLEFTSAPPFQASLCFLSALLPNAALRCMCLLNQVVGHQTQGLSARAYPLVRQNRMHNEGNNQRPGNPVSWCLEFAMYRCCIHTGAQSSCRNNSNDIYPCNSLSIVSNLNLFLRYSNIIRLNFLLGG